MSDDPKDKPKPDDVLKGHEDRLVQIEKRLGIAHKPDNFASEAQSKPKAPSYGRKRH